MVGDQEPSDIHHPYIYFYFIYIPQRDNRKSKRGGTTILVRVARNNRIYLPEFTNDKRSNFEQGMRISHIRIRMEWNRVIQPRSPSSVGTSFFPPSLPPPPAIRILEPSNSARADELRARGVSRSPGLHETSLLLSPLSVPLLLLITLQVGK